ncbi:carbamoyl-phosphate synthase large subunit [Candidatus Hakubella thermalkaliphila]|uniref:Carbamoyl phosphate synthase large chain n=1 Tax=Candidatus Hakubella thermalkaliphila TaxID=2754717 RepID=A0A6V8Q859_9ACTN|nr:carbamoyl-phosphate synthase large subunit [Candidatus Hakubella thermalkaliphila]GFP39636.1 carbamoyl-phosphate synthase large subunit [Candidatus Hakubella thermalkaliphila]
MPRRNDLKKILLIGSGPIIIGQACEFDYAGTQACKVLREEGYEVILVNSNPATIMTDPEFAHKTYLEPLTTETVEKIIAKERPDALLPTLGGQTGLNLAVGLAEAGVLDQYGVELIGASGEAIARAESRELFKKTMAHLGLKVPESGCAHSLEEAHYIVQKLGLPVVIRPSFTLGGTGGGMAYNWEEFTKMVAEGLRISPKGQVLIEKSVAGWKEYELEVMRDRKDNVVIVCAIENFDPMGIHTGDSITVAPAQTLTDKEYQVLRDMALMIIREIGVETGGSNIQFAVNPWNGDIHVIEMNPRVSRSSALASKATGFPIAKIATKVAIGYTLDEIPNDITRKTPSCFEPTLDYVVVKIPRWAFDKFPETDSTLTTRMKAVGEVMAMGRSFKEALQKALRSLETGRYGLGSDGRREEECHSDILLARLSKPNPDRIFFIKKALEMGMMVEEIGELTGIDPWFLFQIKELVDFERSFEAVTIQDMEPCHLREAKRQGYSDHQIAWLCGATEVEVREKRGELRIRPTYKMIDTCAGEFQSETPYFYSTYEEESDEVPSLTGRKAIILGAGPNRIGQGIEFDYACVQASFALKELGWETIMVNCNPETVSTDYDTSDRLYFEPLTYQDVMNILEAEKPDGLIIQLGGQTPLKLARRLSQAGAKILGTSAEKIDLAEDRERFRALLEQLQIPQSPSGTAASLEEAVKVAAQVGYPVLVRPSYVLGGQAMRIVYDRESLERYISSAVEASGEHTVLIDKFLEGAIEVDVDALADGENVFIGGIMEHIEEAGIHSGDSACVIPPYSLGEEIIEKIKNYTCLLAKVLEVVGLVNIQFAVKDEMIYVLEANPRASRTVPFVSKATGIPLARLAAQVMVGKKLKEFGLEGVSRKGFYAVKEAVLPFRNFPDTDTVLGPEMRSTGEVMGIDESFGRAFAKAQLAAGVRLPHKGNIFISVCNRDKRAVILIAKRLQEMGFNIFATRGTGDVLQASGVECARVAKIREGRPNVLDMIKNGDIDLIINTPRGRGSRTDGYYMRTASVVHGVPCITTISGAMAALQAIEVLLSSELEVKALQDWVQ